MNSKELSTYIDHTILKANATKEDIDRVIDEAIEYKFKSVCVNSYWVKYVSQALKGSGVLTCRVVGFPLGAMTSKAKGLETRDAVLNGANEIDMVINIGALKAGDYSTVLEDIKEVVSNSGDSLVKVIIETCYLNHQEKVKACELSVKAGADFVKTSTGFGPGGATEDDIKLMRETVGPDLGVKASGGVRDYETALKMIEAGATRIGASSSSAIVRGESNESISSSY